MSDEKRNYILWTVKAYYDLPRDQMPEDIEAWWGEDGPDFSEWVECETETLVCESISLQDITITGDTCCEVEYVVHLSFDLSVSYEDATEEMNDSIEITLPEGWRLDGLDTVNVEHYSR